MLLAAPKSAELQLMEAPRLPLPLLHVLDPSASAFPPCRREACQHASTAAVPAAAWTGLGSTERPRSAGAEHGTLHVRWLRLSALLRASGDWEPDNGLQAPCVHSPHRIGP